MPTMIAKITSEKGRAVITTALCRAARPPAISSAMVIRPITIDQKMRRRTGASWFTSERIEVKLASTRAPESAEVTKKTMPSTVTTAAVSPTQG